MPLHWIGDDDLRDRIVSGEAAVCAVWRTQRHDEGGDVIEISRYGLPRGERDRDGRGRHLRRCSAGRPATKAPAASAGHDQVLNHLRFIPGADPGEVSGPRVALRAVSRAVEIGFPFLGVAHQDIEGLGVPRSDSGWLCNQAAMSAISVALNVSFGIPRPGIPFWTTGAMSSPC